MATETEMTDGAMSWERPAAPASFFTRRVHAFFRLMRVRRRHRSCANELQFADARMLADVGVRRDYHQNDWLIVLGALSCRLRPQ